MDVEEPGPGCQCLGEINEEHSRIHWSLEEKESSFLTHWREKARSGESVRRLIRKGRLGMSWCSHVELFGVIGMGEMGLSCE